jgi:hypothetical protein
LYGDQKILEVYKRRRVIKSLAWAAAGVALRADGGLSRALLAAGDEFASMRRLGSEGTFGWPATPRKSVACPISIQMLVF